MKKRDHQLDDYFKLYGDVLFRHVHSFVDYHTAEDICQETFLRFAKHMDHVEPKMAKSWLMRVAKRQAIDYLRKGGQYRTEVGLDLIEYELIDERSDVERIVEEIEENREMGRVLACLEKEKPRWFDALLMSRQEDMSDREIGKVMGVKASLIAQWRHRSLLWLRKRYSGEQEEK